MMKENKEKEEVREEEVSATEENTAGAASASENDAAQAEETQKELTPEERIAELETANAELKDQYLRKVADFDNYRKRMVREKQEAFEYANTGLLTDLVAILDDFDRALAASSDAKGSQAVVDGIKMINKQMRGLLEAKYNLSCYGVAGELFDPNIHEAIASNPAPVAEPVLAEVYLKGYMLRERVIRPAKVLVHMPDGSVSSDGQESSDDTKTEEKGN